MIFEDNSFGIFWPRIICRLHPFQFGSGSGPWIYDLRLRTFTSGGCEAGGYSSGQNSPQADSRKGLTVSVIGPRWSIFFWPELL